MSHRLGKLRQIIPKSVLCSVRVSCHGPILPRREWIVNL
jgi:hypothetical protein